MMWRSRSFWRLFGTFGILWLVFVGVLGLLITHRAEQQFLDVVENELRAKAVLLHALLRTRLADDLAVLQHRLEAFREKEATRITLLARDGTVLADSDRDPRKFTLENHRDRPEVQDAQRHGLGMARARYSSTVEQDMMYLALRLDPEAGGVAVVRVALPLTKVQEQPAELGRLVWSTALMLGSVGLVLSYWLARRAARPLQELTTGAQQIAAGNYGRKVYVTTKDEVGTLAGAFNAMSESLAEQFTRLAEERQQLRAILGGMVEGVIAIDAEQRVLFANERAGQMLEFQAQSAGGRKLWEIVRRRGLQNAVEEAFRTPEPIKMELNWNGHGVRFLTVYATQLAAGPSGGAVLVLHDTSELRRLERLRQEFVANVSHELKTPLAVVKACVETLLEGAVLDPEHRGPFLERIAEQAERLHALILDLLSLARIESGEEAFTFEEVELARLVAACLKRHQARAEAQGQTLHAVPPAGHSLSAWADEEAVAQILENLVDNAVKYTPRGGQIWVRWRLDDDHVQLEVEDTGIGISARDLPRIFERFYRVDKARSRELGGTGLGLSIVKHLTQAMHGTVTAASQPGQGTTFLVRLPTRPAS